MDILQQFATAQANGSANVSSHFDQAAQAAPSDVLSHGLGEAFRSNQTPAFGDMIGQLFGQSNSQQQAGMLNQILSTLGPMAMSSIAGGALGNILGPGAAGAQTITPQQASQLTPDQVSQIAAHAERTNPGIVDKLSGFYAEHPTLVKTLGSAAMAIVLSKMHDKMTR
jgi:hypothetical protein